MPNSASLFFVVLASKTKAKTTSFNINQAKKNRPGLTRVRPGGPGGPGPGSTLRVDRVSPGQFPSGFLPSPGPVPGPGRPGPRSTRRAGPGLKTMLYILDFNFLVCNAIS